MIQSIQTSESSDTAPVRQVHFTFVMKPDDPDAKIKFLAEEELHGVGGPCCQRIGRTELRDRRDVEE